MTVTISRFSTGLQVDGFPDGVRYIRPLEARLLCDGCQFAEVISIPGEGPAVVDGFAHPTPDGDVLQIRIGADRYAAPFGAVRALVAGLSCDPIVCAEAEA